MGKGEVDNAAGWHVVRESLGARYPQRVGLLFHHPHRLGCSHSSSLTSLSHSPRYQYHPSLIGLSVVQFIVAVRAGQTIRPPTDDPS